ncbi:hypothetical protein HY500_00290, partial [Candidatus Woesearchaeota archaeon]|nr:hypothetical protein [Candidatus Woesearchaeota archaeon]
IYVVWQGWVEFPPASPGQNNSQPQYTIHYKYYENNEWSLSGIVYSGFAFNNEDADIQLGISENKLQVTYYDHVDGIEKVETIAEIYDEEVQSIKDTLTYNLILNGNIDKNKVISTLYFPSNLSGVKISWSSNDTTIISNKGIVTRDNFTDKDVLLFANLQKGETSDSKEFIVKVKKQVTATVPDGDGKIDAGSNTEVVIDNTNAGSLKQIEVPNTVADDEEVVLNLVTLVNSSKALTLGANNLTLSRNSNTGVSYSVEIPSGTIIQGESNWNGLITVPTVKSTSEVTVTGGTPDLVIEVGSTGVKLTFDKAVRLILPGKAGKSAGYVGTDDVFISIDDCTASEIADPNSLLAEGDCFTISEGDMVIWTKHFTKFVSYSSSSSSSSSSGSGPSGGKIRSNIVIAKEPIKEAIEIPVIEPVKEVPEVAAPTPIAQLTPVQEEQGFFDSLTGAVIGLSGKKSIAAIFVAAVTLVGVIGFYYRNIKRRERIRKQIESIKK